MRMKFEFKLGDTLYYKGKFPFMLDSIKYDGKEVSYIFKKSFYEVSNVANRIKEFPNIILLGDCLELKYEEIFETFNKLTPNPWINFYFETYLEGDFSSKQEFCCREREFFIEREKYILKK